MTMIVGVIVLVIVASILIFVTQRVPQKDIVTQTSEESLNLNKEYTMNEERPVVILQTNEGNITLELFSDLAPKTVDNFVTLAQDDFYDGVRFHRVIEGFMIQGGDPLSKNEEDRGSWGRGGPGYRFEDEIHSENNNLPGTISMANAGPNTNGSQFFINVANNSPLNSKHTVFGKVIDGYDVVERIEKTPTLPNDQPVDDIVIESIIIQE